MKWDEDADPDDADEDDNAEFERLRKVCGIRYVQLSDNDLFFVGPAYIHGLGIGG